MSYYFIEAENEHTIIEHVRRPLAGTELAVENDTIEEAVALVLQRLDKYTLTPSLAPHVHRAADQLAWVKFYGNFEELSGSFCLSTRDPIVIAKLTVAIDANHKSETYTIAQRAWRIERARKEEARR